MLLALLPGAAISQAEKLYKIVDEEGKISFSQYPPVSKDENDTIEDISVNATSHSPITNGIDGRYCGTIKLPAQTEAGYSQASYIKTLDRSIATWKQQLDELNKRVDANNQNALAHNQRQSQRYNRYSQNSPNTHTKAYQQSLEANSEKLRDLRCAIHWADDQYDGTSEYIAQRSTERARLTEIRDELQTELHENCGEIPAYDPRAAGNEPARKSWYLCSDSLRREIDLVQAKLANF